jgi:hypothetical protein
MSFRGTLEATKNRVRAWFSSDELAEIRHDILDQVREQIQELSGSRYLFPFNSIQIEFYARNPGERTAIQIAWVDRGELTSDIRKALARADCEYPDDLHIETRLSDSPPVAGAAKKFALAFEDTRRPAVAPASHAAAGSLLLTVLNGSATPAALSLSAPTTNLGRLREVTDPEGQFVRQNDIAFDEVDNGVNETVGRVHAHIERRNDGRFVLVNSRRSERNPTGILRNGRLIPVVLVDELIQSGDIIQLGRARISVGS